MAERMIDAVIAPPGITRMMESQQVRLEGTGNSSARQTKAEPLAESKVIVLLQNNLVALKIFVVAQKCV